MSSNSSANERAGFSPSLGTPGEGWGGGCVERLSSARTPSLTLPRSTGGGNEALKVHSRPTRNRREFIRDAFCGFGSLAVASILQQQRARAGPSTSLRTGLPNPLAPHMPHIAAKAKSVIF